jgi:hypothetical protein
MHVPENDQLSLAQVASESRLSEIADLVRKVTNSTNQDTFQKTIDIVAAAKNKASAGVDVASAPPMAFLMTDWRSMRVCQADFGFGRPRSFRGLIKSAWGPSVIAYESRGPEEEGGFEFDVIIEEEIVDSVLQDEEVTKWFDFQGMRT